MDDPNALVIADSSDVQGCLLGFLRVRGYSTVVATSGEEALEPLAHRSFRFTLLDFDLETSDIGDLVRRLKTQPGDPGPIIALVASNTTLVDDAATRAVDTVVYKPVSYSELDAAIAVVLSPPAATASARAPVPLRIRQEMDLWRSPRMRQVREIIEEAAGVDVTVLVTGETGTGKEVVANAVHYLSARRAGPFVKVNCAAVPQDLLESELFGHERGAFTGAHKLKIGKFESAHGGTIFLDEIGDLHPSLQAKLLHVLQDGDFSRVGGKSAVKVDVRIIAATNQNLERAVAELRFRADLYYRLNVVHVHVPPLRERTEEIPALVEYFVRQYTKAFRRTGFSIPRAAMERLTQQRYGGNIRELENLVKRMIVLGGPLPNGTAPLVARANADGNGDTTADVIDVPLREIARRASVAAERQAIRMVLEQTGWNRARAAKRLKISYRALLYKMKRCGLRDDAPPRSTPWGGDDSAKGFSA